MNKTAIKNFAIWARVQLIEAAKQRAYEYEITENGENKASIDTIGGRLLTSDEKKQRQQLIAEIGRKGYTQVMEEAAYTWFNRFIALRFMEVNGFLPSKVRVFTDENGNFKPEILKEAMTVEIDGLDRGIVLDLLDKQNNEQLYKYLLITQCNALNQGLPYMFEKISNWTELLFPANLLRPDSVLGQMVTEIPEEDWQDAVQIIGWLYQYYNSELKDETFALLKKNVKISKERIPAATQLFTPDWIVRYMVENSLGRLYINDQLSVGSCQSEAERVAAEKALAEKMGWKYYLPEAEQEPEIRKQLNALTTNHLELTTLKIIDPCMGSGHILVYAFDVLLQIYTSCGWSERDAAKSIIENNLYGLDIDDRAGQLAYFAVMMKARKYSRRILNGEVRPNVLAIQDSGFMTDDFIDYVAQKDQHMKADLTLLRSSLKDAKEYGSIINMPKLNFAALYERMDIISREYAEDIFQIAFQTVTAEQLWPLVKQAEIMAQKYDVVITNPPYMGLKNMSPTLFNYVMKNHPLTKNDLYGVFLQVALEKYANQMAYIGMITQHIWMFTSGFEKYRATLFAQNTISSLLHLGTRAFEEISGEVVQTCAFVICKKHIDNYISPFVRLISAQNAAQKECDYLSGKNRFYRAIHTFSGVPGAPVCYWLSPKVFEAYKNNPLVGDVSTTRQGLKTSDDKRFVRFFFEVDQTKIAHNITNISCAAKCDKKWFWLNKGGQDRWYGNNIYLINWENDGYEVKEYATQVAGSYSKNITAIDAYFKECLSWPQISISHPSFRYIPSGYIFASAGPSLFVNDLEQKWYFLGLLNSCVTQELLDAINPTINFGVSDILKLPFVFSLKHHNSISEAAKQSVAIAKTDWDSFEASWEFKKHPLV